jgi:uncharacterized membrane protein
MSKAAAAPGAGAAEPPVLDLILYPNPPLGRHGTVVVMAIVLVVGAVLGAGFATLGAWPVSGFLGLDVLLLSLALARTRRFARRAEIVRLDARGLVVRRLAPDGTTESEQRLEPFWARVVVDERRRHDPRVYLRAHGRSVPVGLFLSPAERREVARELEAGLAAFRATPPG